ncbi:efflux RND transporter periplasmic adaptor subunit [Rummeliibacillus stabekisii]|uniref:Multidrug transporter n=1 Tax=Rummeliibacillus stabekisii TaxID=241244 RepID=A0A143HEX5_9BACL|nr:MULTISPECIES: efflux RND transporter periplasmic adaptor subunit [Rummeliibacillus]AMX00283.1 multidrug transporter [Rummeliibacillus stabekisii]MCM3317869.1 efflux RND transporter periplasmic adaptor subunit [Rummeliibacillus stabekisii]
MKAKRMILLNVILLIVLVGGGFIGYYYFNQSMNYISTDNAQIAGQQVNIGAPGNGKLVRWDGKVGDTFSKNDTIGTVDMQGTDGKSVNMPIKAPQDGTVVQSNAVENAMVAAGTPLAISYDLDHLWVTANIEETDLDNIKKGQDVDITVDAFPNTTLSGKVQKIGLATAGTFSLLPSNNSSGNYTKETQVIPVKISIDSYGVKLVPGMNVTVRIHK